MKSAVSKNVNSATDCTNYADITPIGLDIVCALVAKANKM